jgi:hypothetical protein
VKVRVKIKVEAVHDSVVKTLFSTLKPDNADFPNKLRMGMRMKKRWLILDFLSQDNLETLVSTIDEVLEHIQTSIGTLEKVV